MWRLAGAMKSDTVFLGNSDLKPLRIDRATKSRALRALEQAGLIKVARQPGRFPEVTVLRALRRILRGPRNNAAAISPDSVTPRRRAAPQSHQRRSPPPVPPLDARPAA